MWCVFVSVYVGVWDTYAVYSHLDSFHESDLDDALCSN